MKSKLFITLIVLAVFSSLSEAQSECKDVLFVANSLFEEGRITESIVTLEPCINQIKNKQEAFEGYKILAIANQELGEADALDKYIKKVLALRPDYQKYPNGDPSVFTKEVGKYQVQPKVVVGLKVGGTLNNVRLVQSYSALNQPQAYNSSLGYQFGGVVYYFINPKTAIVANVMLGGTSINHEIENEEIWNKTYNENLSFLEFSVGANRVVKTVKNTEIFTGLNAGTLVLNKANVSINSTNFAPESFKVDTKDAIEERNKIQPFVGAVIGASIPLERGKLDIELGYDFFLSNTVVAETRMNDIDFIFDSQYINDDIKLGLTTLSFTYSLPLNYQISK